MFRITSEAELMNCFRPRDRDEVVVPERAFPLSVRDYLTWLEPSGVRVYLVFRDPLGGALLGIVFRRDQGNAVEPAMCEWCHSVRGGGSVGLLTARASSRRRIGISLCRDLSCAEKSETYDDGSSRLRVKKVIERMTLFARRNIF
ncbi:MAG: FBP domain-containing protein [Bdellovibrionota bacterium]